MTPLRMRMTEDMRVAGLAAGTQVVYIDGVRRVAKHYGSMQNRGVLAWSEWVPCS